MSDVSRYEVSNNWVGRRSVKYPCPCCGERLCSPLRDAGTTDHCPTCRRVFTVPGLEALNQFTAKKQAAEAYAANLKAEQKQARQLREIEKVVARKQAEKAAEDARRERERLTEESQQASPAVSLSTNSIALTQRATTFLRTWWIGGGVAVTVICIMTLYGALRGADLRSKLERCDSKGVVKVRVSYAGFIGRDTIIFDLRDGINAGARRIDPVHLLMQFGEQLDLSAVDRVILARNGQARFYISGFHLRRLTDSYAAGGRIRAFNNLPAHVRRLDGTRAFEEWSGGWLGVLREQVNDLNDFITEWTGYDDASNSAIGADDASALRSHVRATLRDIEDNVPETLKLMEDNLPEVMADVERQMLKDAATYGLSPSDVTEQLRAMEAGAQEQIRAMEDDIRAHIRGMEDEAVESLLEQRL